MKLFAQKCQSPFIQVTPSIPAQALAGGHGRMTDVAICMNPGTTTFFLQVINAHLLPETVAIYRNGQRLTKNTTVWPQLKYSQTEISLKTVLDTEVIITLLIPVSSWDLITIDFDYIQ